MLSKNTNGTPSTFKMLEVFSRHTNNNSSKNLESMEPNLEASLTLSGNEQVPDYLIGKSNGVDSSKFLNEESDLEIPKQKRPDSNLGGLRSMVSPLRAIRNATIRQ